MIKKIFIVTLIFCLTSCGYSSVYKNNKSTDLDIRIIEMTGDIEMNNLIKNQLEIFTNDNSENKYEIKINTSYSKKVISKNTQGAASNYELSVTSKFEFGTMEISFIEKFNVKNISDSIEQRNYEQIIKENFASSIREKLIIKLLSLE